MENFRLLIVEDNPGFALEVEMLVKTAGYQLIGVVDNSEDAIEVALKDRPDLIIMDIDILGNMNGVEVAKQLKGEKIPVIFTTSIKDKAVFEEAKDAISYAYLVKPFDMLTLQSAIEFAVKMIVGEANGQNGPGGEWKEDLVLQDYFLIKGKKNVLRKVKCSDIIYVESDWNYCVLHADNRKYAVKMSLKKICETLGNRFVPVHKSYLVQFDRIDGIDTSDNKVLLGNVRVPIGRTFRNDLIRRFKLLK